jgi:hypothetical protein
MPKAVLYARYSSDLQNPQSIDDRRARQGKLVCQGRINGTTGSTREHVHILAKRLKNGEWLIVATNRPDPKQALDDDRKRWGIECLFGDAKTRGLNIEDTHITNPEKLGCLIVVVMLAITWAYRCATHGHEGRSAQTPRPAREIMVPHRPRRPQGPDHQSARQSRLRMGRKPSAKIANALETRVSRVPCSDAQRTLQVVESTHRSFRKPISVFGLML